MSNIISHYFYQYLQQIIENCYEQYYLLLLPQFELNFKSNFCAKRFDQIIGRDITKQDDNFTIAKIKILFDFQIIGGVQF